MSRHDDEELRARISGMLAQGLETQTEPFPETQREFGRLLDELSRLDRDDLAGKLVVSGFTNAPYGQERMRCQECMYYLVHRRWCDLPELALPVEPDWWCRLWRI